MNHVIIIEDHAYVPASIRISARDTVTWDNRDGVRHTATRKDSPAFDTGYIMPGTSSTPVAFSEPTPPAGIDYFCLPHPFMRGTIFVDTEASDGTTAATQPQPE
jgi:plastocyanin